MDDQEPGPSRSTVWRHRKEDREEAASYCDCKYHGNNDEACQCKYHGSTCQCQYHTENHMEPCLEMDVSNEDTNLEDSDTSDFNFNEGYSETVEDNDTDSLSIDSQTNNESEDELHDESEDELHDESEDELHGESEDELEDEGDGHRNPTGMSWDSCELDRLLNFAQTHTVREVCAMIVAIAVRHNWDYESMLKTLVSFNTLLHNPVIPSTKKQFWAALGKKNSGQKKHVYCVHCFTVLGKMTKQTPLSSFSCPNCLPPLKREVSYFVTLSFIGQLNQFLKNPNAAALLQYRHTRQKLCEENVEDILDGEVYNYLQTEHSMDVDDYSYLLYLDGFSKSKSSNTHIWAVLTRLNDLKPSIRQKHGTFLVALYVGSKEPDFNVLLQNTVKEGNILSSRGIMWQSGGLEVTSRFFPAGLSADARARAPVIGLTQCTGLHSCPYCEHPGVLFGSVAKFPLPGSRFTMVDAKGVERDVHVPSLIPLRTHESALAQMTAASENAKVMGFKHPSVLMLLDTFRLVKGLSPDDLHPIYEGVAKLHIEFLLASVSAVPNLMKVLDDRLLAIKLPSQISRKPRTMKSKDKFQGTEWRNLLLYLIIPCLHGLIPGTQLVHLGRLSEAVFLLSRDSIPPSHFTRAAEKISLYMKEFQDRYGPENMRFNVHLLPHIVTAAKFLGPIWSHGTFNFESWLGRLGRKVTSPKGVAAQIVDRFSLIQLADSALIRDDLSEDVKTHISSILKTSKALPVTDQVQGCYLLGTGELRQASAEERALLQGYNCQEFVEYKQVFVNGCRCSSVKYESETERKSRDCVVYCKEDFFCAIDSIIVFEHNFERICLLFVTVYDIGNRLADVYHIVEIRGKEEKEVISADSVRNLAIEIRVGDQSFITAMSSQHELD